MWDPPPCSPKAFRGLLSAVWQGKGSRSPRGVIQPRAPLPPPCFLSNQMEKRVLQSLDSLRAPQRWPPGLQTHLPAVAEPAEGWAARQAPTAAPGAHASCRLSTCWREGCSSHQTSRATESLRLCPAPGFPTYLVARYR